LEKIGHLIPGDISSGLAFRLFSKANASVGDFVLLKDKHLETENEFIGRITNIGLSILGRGDFLADMSTQMEVSPFEVDPYEFRDSRSEILVRMAEISLIGLLNGNSIAPPKKVPNHLCPVLIPTVKEMNWITTQGDIKIGELRAEMSGDGEIPIMIDSEILVKKHLFIAAMTGSGKSITVKTIISGLYKENKCGILIFDVHGEYGYSSNKTKGLKELDGENVKIYGFGDNDDNHLKINYNDLTEGDIYHFYDWSPAQREGLGIIFYNEENPLSYINNNSPENMKERYGIHKDTALVLKRRINQIISGKIDFVTPDDVNNLYDNILTDLRMNKIVIIDFTKISEQSENILINTISRKILNNNKRKVQRENKDPKNVLIILEESQRFLDASESKNKGVMRELVREGRKFGVGLCAVTQIPRFFDERILSQFNTYIILKLANSRDRTILEGGAPRNISDMFTEIATLYPGEAVIVGEAIPLALPVKIDNFDDLNFEEYKRESEEMSPLTPRMGIS